MEDIKTADRVTKSGTVNRYGCQIVITHKQNLKLLEQLLTDHEEKEIVQWLTCGWPINRGNQPVESVHMSHKGATTIENEVDDYLDNEIRLGATISPF